MATRLDHSRDAKLEKRKKLESLGVNVHPYSYNPSHTIHQALELHGKNVRVAGRIAAIREHGGVCFVDLKDQTGSIQIIFREDVLKKTYEQLSFVDTGDFVGAEGIVGASKTGETSIEVQVYTFLGKSLRPIPSSWQGIDDPEVRYRKRYLDMLINPVVKQTLDARWLIEKEIRRYLQDDQNFVEVETPILQPLYGGTNARPFTTHMNALDSDFYLRIAPELYLKRLIVGGYERIFEIARNFRNEGVDLTHQPEFTMIEWYEAYADYNRMMDVTEGLMKHLTKKLHGKLELKIEDTTVSLAGKWPRITMLQAIKQHLKLDVDALTDTQIQSELKKRKIELTGSYSKGKAVYALFEHGVTDALIEPTWIIDYPKEVSPLSKEHRKHPELVERFEGYIGGREICDGWSEVTDALDQRKRFEVEQQHLREGDEEAQPLDEEFLEAMEYGMPPLGGIGIGIDRLVMFLTNTWAIREVIAFPTLRPIQQTKGTAVGTKTSIKTTHQQSLPGGTLPDRSISEALMEQHIQNDALQNHVRMVARAMERYAEHLGEDKELWYQTGLLHDLDWEEYPDEHPNKAVSEWLINYPSELKLAIEEHAPDRTGKQATSILGKYLFACDEISGFLHAVSLMRPTGFSDMKPSSVKKKMKDRGFAKNVSREDIERGIQLIEVPFDEHVTFLIETFNTTS